MIDTLDSTGTAIDELRATQFDLNPSAFHIKSRGGLASTAPMDLFEVTVDQLLSFFQLNTELELNSDSSRSPAPNALPEVGSRWVDLI
jgi:hypothetical protein